MLSQLEEEIKEEKDGYSKRLSKIVAKKKEVFIDKKAITEICEFKAIKKLYALSKEKNA